MPEETQTHYQPAQPRQSLGIPVAIVIAAALVAGAIIYTGSSKPSTGTQIVGGPGQVEQQTPEVEIAPVTEKDHILGNPNAPIVIVEYSDYDCPFCKNFHETMHRIMDEYGADGKVAWVYRHFPLTQLHPNAEKIAEASECVASIGGNDAFWKFSDFIFSERGTNEPTDIARLPEFAERAGVSKDTYTQCMDTGKFAAAIDDAVTAALNAGAQGTPYSILIAGDQQGPINGAQPYATVKQMIDTILAQTGASN